MSSNYTFITAPSAINGLGLFTEQALPSDQILFVAFENRGGVATQSLAAACINHASLANCKVAKHYHYYLLRTTRPLQPGEEITIDYQQAMSVLDMDGVAHPDFFLYRGNEGIFNGLNANLRQFKNGDRWVVA